ANAIEPIVAYLGALRAGHPVLLLPAGASELNRRLLDIYRPDAHLAWEGNAWQLTIHPQNARLHPDLALVLPTSGSTGASKLVRLSQSAIRANAASIVEYLEIGADDCALTSLPIHYSYGLSVLNTHLLAGARIVLTDRSVIDPVFWSLFEQ